jgi:hypothetical protein
MIRLRALNEESSEESEREEETPLIRREAQVKEKIFRLHMLYEVLSNCSRPRHPLRPLLGPLCTPDLSRALQGTLTALLEPEVT